jgi:drug/metabolite transporter superfamily protein YnfA
VIFWSGQLIVGVSGLALSLIGGAWLAFRKVKGNSLPVLAIIGAILLLLVSVGTILTSPAKIVTEHLSSGGEDGR